MKQLVLLLSFVAVCWAAGCPQVTPHTNLDLGRFAGNWYGVEVLRSHFLEIAARCLRITFRPTSPITADINATATLPLGFHYTIQGRAEVLNPLNAAYMMADLHGARAPFIIVSTDYHNFATYYACLEESNGSYTQYGAILSRGNPLDFRDIFLQKSLLAMAGVDISKMYSVGSNQC